MTIKISNEITKLSRSFDKVYALKIIGTFVDTKNSFKTHNIQLLPNKVFIIRYGS